MSKLSADRQHPVTLTLNGERRSGMAAPRLLLSDFLRHELASLGTHVGCEHGVCGACTILVDGLATRSCLMFAVQADGRDVQTVEGLGAPDTLTPLQAAFQRHHALQCGFCTPGILMSAVDFLKSNGNPDESEVRDMLGGHLCRCTGYTGIVRAILDAATSSDSDCSPTGTNRQEGDS